MSAFAGAAFNQDAFLVTKDVTKRLRLAIKVNSSLAPELTFEDPDTANYQVHGYIDRINNSQSLVTVWYKGQDHRRQAVQDTVTADAINGQDISIILTADTPKSVDSMRGLTTGIVDVLFEHLGN